MTQNPKADPAEASWSATFVFVTLMIAFGALAGLALGLAAR